LSKMLYDLNVPWSLTQNPIELQRTLAFLSELGFGTVALNHVLTGALPSQVANPIPQQPSFTIPSGMTLLRRCTIHISDPTLNHRLPQFSSVYDILAIRPTTEKGFLAACQTLTEHSIISLDLTQNFPFHFKQKNFMTAVNRGIRVEICYSQATMGDAVARRNFISNTLGILRATKGRGLILSSEARGVLGVRAPADLINLMAVWGLGREKGMDALGTNPRGVVMNERIKRTSFRGVIDVIDGGKRDVGKGFKGKGKGSALNGLGKQEENNKNGKRKREDKKANEDEVPTISKRQAKKMKKEAEMQGLSSAKEVSTSEDLPGPSHKPDTPSTIKAKANG
jgi:ribonuclease P/MRP protein subunit RPP1